MQRGGASQANQMDLKKVFDDVVNSINLLNKNVNGMSNEIATIKEVSDVRPSLIETKEEIPVLPLVQDVIWGNQDVKYLAELITPRATQKVGTIANYSDTQFSFDYTPPQNQFMDRRVYVRVPLRFNMTGADQGVPLISLGVNDAPRFMPFQSQVSTNTVQVNGLAFTSEPEYMCSQLWRGVNNHNRIYSLSGCPNMLDFYQEYNDAVSFGFNRDPLKDTGNNSYEQTRGGFRVVSSTISNTAAQIDIEVIEPVLCPPFIPPHEHSKKGLLGIETLNINFNIGNLAKSWCHSSAGPTLSTVACTIYDAPAILLNFYEQNLYVPVPKMPTWSFNTYKNYASSTQSVAQNASTTFNMPSIKISSVPAYIIAWAQKAQNLKNYLDSDVYPRINSMSLQWDMNPFFAGTSPYQLWLMSYRNGLNVSYDEWYNKTGGLLIIRPGDFGMPAGLSPGTQTNVQFDFTMNITNISSSAVAKTMECRIEFIYDNLLYLSKNVFYSEESPLQRGDLLDLFSKYLQNSYYKLVGMSSVQRSMLGGALVGGNIFGTIGKWIKKGVGAIKKYAPKVLDVLDLALPSNPYVAQAQNIRKAVGLGEGGFQLGGNIGMSDGDLSEDIDQYMQYR